jgi:type II secretory pathway pseudopilin PulG
MKKIYYFVAFVFVIVGILFAVIIYNYNKDVELEQTQHQQEINRIKEEQSRLNAQFEQEQQNKQQQHIIAENDRALQLKQDMDGDGLTLEQELKLGTSDDNPDSDGDGIKDSNDRHPAGGGETYTITVHWLHNKQPYTTQFGIAEDWYWFYKNKLRDDYRYTDARFVTYKDPVIQTIAKDITDTSISSGDQCKFCIAIDFVESMIYQKDIEYISRPDYPKYPIETIKDEKGDCEDTSFLMASILKALNVDMVLLRYSDHMAVGFASSTCPGDSYIYQGKTFCFLETTGVSDNPAGDFTVWGKYVNEKPSVIEVI